MTMRSLNVCGEDTPRRRPAVFRDIGKKIVLGLVAVACLVGAHAALVASVVS